MALVDEADWKRLSPLLDRALELDGAERADYLASLRLADPDTGAAVEGLLASHERALASIAEARSLDAEGQAYLRDLDRATPIAFHCHHGFRSQAAAQQMLAEGFRNVYNLRGGIDAWSTEIDPQVPRY